MKVCFVFRAGLCDIAFERDRKQAVEWFVRHSDDSYQLPFTNYLNEGSSSLMIIYRQFSTQEVVCSIKDKLMSTDGIRLINHFMSYV